MAAVGSARMRTTSAATKVKTTTMVDGVASTMHPTTMAPVATVDLGTDAVPIMDMVDMATSTNALDAKITEAEAMEAFHKAMAP